MRGRKPELHVVKSNVSSNSAVGALDLAPPGMSEDHAIIWRHLVSVAPRGHLRSSDSVLVAMTVHSIAAYDAAVQGAWRGGILVPGERGSVFNPNLRAALRLSAHTVRLLEALGLTPATAGRTERRQ